MQNNKSYEHAAISFRHAAVFDTLSEEIIRL